MLTTAHVRPFVVAILLHRGAVKPHEVWASLTPHCCSDDLKVGGWDPLDNDYCEGTRVEKLVDEVLGEFVSEGLVRYNEEQDLWVLTANHIPKVISWVTALGARMPQHLLCEMTKQQVASLPEENISTNAEMWDGTDIEPTYPRSIKRSKPVSVDDCYVGEYQEGDRFS
jgi:hypothetical protein